MLVLAQGSKAQAFAFGIAVNCCILGDTAEMRAAAKAGFGFGGARGSGEVFEDGKVIGSTTLTQLSFGFQLGGQAFSQIIFFQNKRDLDRFTDGNFEFGASASAALITEGANASVDYTNGVAVMTFSKGGLMYEASIGGQKFTFKGYI